jgi:hypothetical protein
MKTDVRMLDEYERPYGVRHVDHKPRVSSTPYLSDIAEGRVSGHTGWQKMGFNSDIQSTEEIVSPQGGTYAFPTAKMQMTVISSNDQDDPAVVGTGVAGTGVHSLTIYYLDNDYVEQSETVTLNGQTTVDTKATDILRIQNVRVTSAGTGLKAAGNISVKGKVDSVTYGYIAIGNTRQRQFAWTVPAGKTLYITQANVYMIHTAANKVGTMTLRASYDDKLGKRLTNGIFMPYAEALNADTPIPVVYTIPKRFPEKVDIIVVGKSTGTASMAISMAGWTETN